MPEKPPRKPRLKSAIAPVERPGRKREQRPSKAKPPELDGRKNPGKRILSPIQIRVLDTMFDPACSTRADVAHVAKVSEKTITHWIAEHPPFREEYHRRLHYRGDRIGDLFTQALRLAIQLHIEVLSNKDGKYTLPERLASAKEILSVGRQHVEVLNIQQTQVNVGAPPTPGPAGELPSVRRLTDMGLSQPEALRMDASEMKLMIEQLAAGIQVAGEGGVIEGEVVDAPGRS